MGTVYIKGLDIRVMENNRSPHESVNANTNAVAIAGKDTGRTTLRRACSLVAPSTSAASSSPFSMLSR